MNPLSWNCQSLWGQMSPQAVQRASVLSCPVQASPVQSSGPSLVGCDCAECSNSCGPTSARLSVNAIRTFLIQELLTHFSHMIPPTQRGGCDHNTGLASAPSDFGLSCLLQVSVNIQNNAELFKEHKFKPLEVQPTQRNTWKENWGDRGNLY